MLANTTIIYIAITNLKLSLIPQRVSRIVYGERAVADPKLSSPLPFLSVLKLHSKIEVRCCPAPPQDVARHLPYRIYPASIHLASILPVVLWHSSPDASIGHGCNLDGSCCSVGKWLH